ncbi:phage tail tape measure protein [Vibrio algicola]|uniref:Phage tail tape measure protein n=1 Tax=Vibrio algicola TaxID=2662262 RepID=A0A5Q0TF40_9VIBR|nr:phage tail tape measure protein [Vibrio algicola]
MAMEKLMMQIGLIDQVSKPLGKMQRQFDSLAQQTKKSFTNIGIGAAGIFAGGAAIKSAMMPAIEMDRKMGELASLGTTQKSMDSLKQSALSFSVAYGKSATEFVEASYDIQSAIAGLKGNELAQFTKASGVLAAATKSDTKTITNYMGTMYGIFKNQADKMGKGEWVEQVAGQTASAVQMFKTTGAEMSGAFSRLGADATGVGVSMNEQMAILGTLQATMSGSEAGTKYRAFLKGADKAQKALNLTFVDSENKLLPMTKILEKIKGKYGDVIDVAESAELTKAFGTAEASGMIKLLMADVDGLGTSIDKLGDVKGMKVAEQMAAKQTDQWERLDQALDAVKIVLGGAILPTLAKVASAMANGSKELMKYMNQYPTLTKYAGFAITAILGIGIALGIATIAAGFFGGAMAIITSPITAVVLGVAALGAGIIYFWDYIQPFLVGFYNGFVKASGVSVLFEPLLDMFSMIGDGIGWVIDKIASWLPQMDAGTDAITRMGEVGEMLGQAFAKPFKFIIDKLQFIMSKIRSVIDFAKSLPFMGDDDEVTKVTKQINKTASNDSVYQPYNATTPTQAYSYLQGQKQTNVPVGGIRSQLTNNNNGKTVNIHGVTVNQSSPSMSIEELAETQDMAHG